jgi:hypothetical protein
MKNGQWIVAGIMGLAVVLAAMIAGTPVGVADNPQPPQWEVAAGLDRPEASPSDYPNGLVKRVERLENRVANIERSGWNTAAPTSQPAAAAVPPSPIVATESWQEYKVVDVPAVFQRLDPRAVARLMSPGTEAMAASRNQSTTFRQNYTDFKLRVSLRAA